MAAALAQVLTLGIATLDHVFGVPSIPHAAEKFRAGRYAAVAGGCAATAAVAVSRLGGIARLCARLGDDATGKAVVAALESEGVDCSLCARSRGATSPLSCVLIDPEGERLIVNFRGEGLVEVPDVLTAGVMASADAALADTRWPEGAAHLMALARQAGRPGVVDAEAPFDDMGQALELASHVAFSAQGLRAYTGHDDLDAALAAARSRLPGWLCVTDGPAGVRYTDGKGFARCAAPAVAAVDTLGAGDVWHGAFTLALGEGRPEARAVAFATAAAALKCTRNGGWAAIPDRAEAEALLAGGDAR